MSPSANVYATRAIDSPPMPPELSDDHVARICSVLHQHRVSFVVIGGIAARLHETGHSTVDIDICPSRSVDNLKRLSTALIDMGARLRVEGSPAGVVFDAHPEMLKNVTTLTLATDLGPLDLCFAPAAFPEGYEALAPGALTIEVRHIGIPVASLGDVVSSKRAAGRPKDIVALPALEARLRELG